MKKTTKINVELLEAFRAHTDPVNGKASLAQAAKAMRYSLTTLSLYRKGDYKGNIEDVEASVVAYLGLAADRKSAPTLNQVFVPNGVVRRVYEMANITLVEKEVGLITGRAGIGKTEGLAWFMRDNPDCIFISANHAYTPRVVFGRILEILGLPKPASLQRAFEFVVDKLTDSDRMVIVDQAEYLSHKALEMLRSVHDEAKVGVLLVGLPRLYHNIRHEGAVHEQVYSRIGVYHNLDDKLTEEDAQALFKALTGVERDIPRLREFCRGNSRRLVKLAKRGLVIAQNSQREIDAEIIEAAGKYLVF